MNNKNKKFSLTCLAVLTIAVSGNASAELYISPVVKTTAKIEKTNLQKASTSDVKSEVAKPSIAALPSSPAHTSPVGLVSIAQVNKGVVSTSDLPKKNTLPPVASLASSEKVTTTPASVAPMGFGKNIPLFVAVDKVVPNSKSWVVNYDKGLETKVVSWNGGDKWENVLKAISEQNNISIQVNHNEKAIGISKDEKLSTYMANRVPQIWELEVGKGLQENITAWANKAGWKVAWDEKLRIDYPVSFYAVFTGKFEGKDGAVEQLMLSIADKDKPLAAEFYEGNKVVVIKEAAFSQEVLY